MQKRYIYFNNFQIFEKIAKEIHLFPKFQKLKKNGKRDTTISIFLNFYKKKDKRDTSISKILKLKKKVAKEIHPFSKFGNFFKKW